MRPTEQELKTMFGETPDSFTLAMERALAGEKPASAEQKPRRLSRTWSIALIIALALALTTGAYAAAVKLGFIDFVGSGAISYIPQSALDVLASTEVQTWEVGPLTVSLNEVIADGHLVFIACQTRPTDDSEALLCGWDILGRTPESVKNLLGLEEEYLIEAAAAYEGPIYTVQTRLEIDHSLTQGEEMEMDPVIGSDGSILTDYMVETTPELVGDTIQGELRVDVNLIRINNVTRGEYMIESDRDILESWVETFPVTFSVTGVIETKSYQPAEEADLGWAIIERVDVERTPAGLYTYTKLRFTDEDISPYHAYNIQIMAAPDDDYEVGLYQSGSIEVDDFPEAVLMEFISRDKMPESLYLLYDDLEIEVR